MPELPEVETVVRLIRPAVVGRRILDAHVAWRRTVGGLTERAFARAVSGLRVVDVRRRAKYALFDLEPAGVLVGHLRMTGRLTVERAPLRPGPWSRVWLDFDDGTVLHFLDVRKFGRLVYGKDDAQVLPPLGPEPLGDGFTAAWLRAALRRRRRALKPLLLDQGFLAGLGNIYVDEALHRARLHPLRRSDRVPPRAADRLHAEIRAVLTEAIAREGSSFDGFYRTPEGNPGRFQHQFAVYARDGQACRTCGRTIRKLVVGQRGTHVCPRCQPAPRDRRR